MDLTQAQEGKEYIIRDIVTEDEEMDAFLFSLGCYSGEPITVISHLKGGCVVSIKDGRYNIDKQLAAAILIWSTKVAEHEFGHFLSEEWLASANRNGQVREAGTGWK